MQPTFSLQKLLAFYATKTNNVKAATAIQDGKWFLRAKAATAFSAS